MENSAFLKAILSRANVLAEENGIGLTRDLVFIAALMELVQSRGKKREGADEDEFRRTRELLSEYSGDLFTLIAAVKKLSGRKLSSGSEKIFLILDQDSAERAAKKASMEKIPADYLIREMLRNESVTMRELKIKEDGKSEDEDPEIRIPEDLSEDSPFFSLFRKEDKPSETQVETTKEDRGIGALVERTKKLRSVLQSAVFGQDRAINAFTAAFFQAELQAMIDRDRVRPRATFLFAGPPGVGKTFFSETAASPAGLNLPFKRFDMSEYTDREASADTLSGYDRNYRHPKEGQLTGFVKRNPRCVLLFDEIEKAYIDVLYLFYQILDAGCLKDNKTEEEVSFRDTILIFTTNAGKGLYDGQTETRFSCLPRDVILDALAKDIDPRTKQPYFPEALCSRFANGNVLMFDRLDAHSLHRIAEEQLRQYEKKLYDDQQIRISFDRYVPSVLLFAEGASADARKVRGRVESFFGTELFELYRLLPRKIVEKNRLRSIVVRTELQTASKEIRELFIPNERVHALVCSDHPFTVSGTGVNDPVLHAACTMEEVKRVMADHDIRLIFCDLFARSDAGKEQWLNKEDFHSPFHALLFELLERYPDVPVILTETEKRCFSDEEKDSFYRRGIYSFLQTDSGRKEQMVHGLVESVFQKNNLRLLARANKLIRYETAQRMGSGGTEAEIVLLDMKLEKAVRYGDSDTVLSMMSVPDVHFSDVIGAEDAKRELTYFINYVKNPKKYASRGAAIPKGILLYGPPGTGKTMLAKAFAAESGATFIALEGNRFFQPHIGESPAMMHRVFSVARRYAPAVLFIDEIDTIGRTRSGENTGAAQVGEQVLTALFAEMDGFIQDASRPVFVLGATNYRVESTGPMSLDPAFLRRFDRRILIDLPDKDERVRYLKDQMARKPILNVKEKTVLSLADRSVGMSLAQLASILQMAIRTAFQMDASSVSDEMVEEAFETFLSGEKRQWSPEEVLRTARHESGHALLSWLSGDTPSYLTIVSRGNYGGYMQTGSRTDRGIYTKAEMTNLIRTALGGRAAEIVYYGDEDGVSTGAFDDLKKATGIAKRMICEYGMDPDFGLQYIDANETGGIDALREEVRLLLSVQMESAVCLLSENREKLDRLVEALMKKNSLREHEISSILRGLPLN